MAFDSIYDALTPEERTTLVKRIVDRGIQPTLDDWVQGGKRIHALDSMGHNWWSACVFGAGIRQQSGTVAQGAAEDQESFAIRTRFSGSKKRKNLNSQVLEATAKSDRLLDISLAAEL